MFTLNSKTTLVVSKKLFSVIGIEGPSENDINEVEELISTNLEKTNQILVGVRGATDEDILGTGEYANASVLVFVLDAKEQISRATKICEQNEMTLVNVIVVEEDIDPLGVSFVDPSKVSTFKTAEGNLTIAKTFNGANGVSFKSMYEIKLK